MLQGKQLITGIGSSARSIFRTREVQFHEGEAVRRVRISARAQVAAVAVAVAFAGWSVVATVAMFSGSTRDAELQLRDRQIAAMRADMTALKETADEVAGRVEARQQVLAGLLSGQADVSRMAKLLNEPGSAEPIDQRYASALSTLIEAEERQLNFADQAATAAEVRYRDTQALLKRLGLAPTRFIRQSRIAMGGPYEPIDKDSDPAFRKLFSSWSKVNTLERGMLSVPSLKPVKNFRLTSEYGVRRDPFVGRAAMHSGIDMAGPVGEPIYATADGVVGRAGWGNGYGKVIDLDHGRGIETRYAHLSAILVKPGQEIKRGDLIGRMGSTGRSTGSHLHYEVRIDGRSVNPVPFLQSAEQLAAVHVRAMDGKGGPALPTID